MLLLGMTPLALLLTRNPAPHESAAAAAGGVEAGASLGACCAAGDHLESENVGFTLSQAMRTQAFWVFGLAISVIALIGSGQSLFNESVLNQQGFPAEMYYNLITLTGVVGLLVKLPVGWLGQHCALNRLHAVGLLLLAACLMWLPFIHATWQITLYGVGMGISGTITTVLFFTIWGQAYGRAHLGQIQAVAQMLTVLASAAGPKVMAETFHHYGSYAPAFRVLAGVVAVLGVWSVLVRVPSPQEALHFVRIPLARAIPQEN
jgi:hypothetical protein